MPEKKAPTSASAEKTASSGQTSEMTTENSRPGRSTARNQDVLPGILGKQLKAAYSELLNAPVPDAINDLVKALKNKEFDGEVGDCPRTADESKEDGQ